MLIAYALAPRSDLTLEGLTCYSLPPGLTLPSPFTKFSPESAHAPARSFFVRSPYCEHSKNTRSEHKLAEFSIPKLLWVKKQNLHYNFFLRDSVKELVSQNFRARRRRR